MITIRKAETIDAETLCELISNNAQLLLEPYYTPIQMEAFIKYYSMNQMQQKLSNQEIFCAIKNGQIAGTIGLDKDMVVGFYTSIDYLREGIGAILLKYIEEYAKRKGLDTIYLASSPAGLPYYLKRGWIKDKEMIYEYCGVDFEETFMFKKL